MEEISKRDSNLELYRIILMLLIISHHYVVNSGLMDYIYSKSISFNSIFLVVFGAWGKIGINCFVLITGYFMYKKNISLKKFLKLIFEVLFYNVLFGIIFFVLKYNSFNAKDLLKSILIYDGVNTNFTTSYILFYLLIPFLNILIKNLDKKKHLLMIIVFLFIYSILGNIPNYSFTFNYVSFFCFIYFIGSYLAKYCGDTKKNIWNISTFISIILCITSVILGLFYSNKTGNRYIYFFVNDANKFLAVVTSVCIFMTFKNMKFKYNKCINYISSSIFGVLLIHANCDAMRHLIWKDIFNNVGMFNSQILFLHAIICVLLIFVVCIIIDKIRIYFIEKPFFKIFDKKIDKLEEKIYNYIN